MPSRGTFRRHLGFNTPEGVEGFSRPRIAEIRVDIRSAAGRRYWERFNTPEGVEGFSSCPFAPRSGAGCCFNTPEGVEGFSSAVNAIYLACRKRWRFQYPGGC